MKKTITYISVLGINYVAFYFIFWVITSKIHGYKDMLSTEIGAYYFGLIFAYTFIISILTIAGYCLFIDLLKKE